MKIFINLFSIICILVIAGCASSTSIPTASSAPVRVPVQILFDDFSYSTLDEMTANGWIIRSERRRLPGVTGASFRAENVSFIDYPAQARKCLLRMTSSTDGTGANTYQTQICHQRKYFEGTYAARVRFSDVPVSGSDGDQIVETFYTITPYEKPFDPDYSEMDFEYLPNGGWGGTPTTITFTTWETVQIEPWNADNASNSVRKPRRLAYVGRPSNWRHSPLFCGWKNGWATWRRLLS